ncbi:MAG: zinc dependent phospholipase C family protein [Clostridia bacterium]|nr:zinc dependent phospholipase C family protein [Clostridia bacterium]
MPDYFAHRIFAENVYDILPEETKKKIVSKERYLLGAQGCDIFFFYRLVVGKKNMGCIMHETDAKELFSKLKEGDMSYLLGFCTHYALDSVFHPIVYKYAGTSHRRHVAYERDIGTFISKKFGKDKTIFTKKQNTDETASLQKSIRSVIPKVTKRRMKRTLTFFYWYTRNLYRRRRTAYDCDANLTAFEGLLTEATEFAVTLIIPLAEGEFIEKNFSKRFLEGKYEP